MPRPRALYKASPEDFRVEEVPLYAPSGSGEHLYVTFEKRGLTTDEAVRLLSRAASVQPATSGRRGEGQARGDGADHLAAHPAGGEGR